MRVRFGVLAAVFLAACSDGPTVTEHIRPQESLGVQSVDDPHFSFLPPLAAGTINGDFNPDLRPAVEICRLDEFDACQDSLQKFVTAPGQIEVSLENEHYRVNWQIEGVTAGAWYRIRVLSGGFAGAQVLGSIDLQGTEGGGLYNPSGGGSNIQSTLPIKFRLEHGLLCSTLDDDNFDEPCLVVSVGPEGGTFATTDEKAGAYFPPGALKQEYVNLYIEKWEPGDPDDQYNTFCLPTSLPQYGGCYRFKTEPQLDEVQGQALIGKFDQDVVVGICPDPAVFEEGILNQLDIAKWDEVNESSLKFLERETITFLDCPGYVPESLGSVVLGLPQPLRWLAQLLGPTPASAGPPSPFGAGLSDFSRIGWVRPLAFQKVAGDNQTAYVSDEVFDDPTVRVYAAGSKVTPFTIPVAGVPLQFSASSGGSAAPESAVTDANGYASTVWTLGAAGANTLVVSGLNPLADPNASELENFPNRKFGSWGSVTFNGTSVEPPPPPPPAAYTVVFREPIEKGRLKTGEVNVLGVPVELKVCHVTTNTCFNDQVRQLVSNTDYRFQWKSLSSYPAGTYTFQVMDGATPVGSPLVGTVAKDGTKLPRGVDFSFQLGSNVPVKFFLIRK